MLSECYTIKDINSKDTIIITNKNFNSVTFDKNFNNLRYSNNSYEYSKDILKKIYQYTITISNQNLNLVTFEESFSKLKSLKNLEDNWDDEGADHISEKIYNYTYDLIKKLYVAPIIAPASDGTIGLSYLNKNKKNITLDFEIYENHIEYLFNMDGFKEDNLFINDKTYIEMNKLIREFYEIT